MTLVERLREWGEEGFRFHRLDKGLVIEYHVAVKREGLIYSAARQVAREDLDDALFNIELETYERMVAEIRKAVPPAS